MGIIEICVAFITVILGIAYPILLEVISRLDDKYSSQIVVELFRTELVFRLFRTLLIISLILILLWILIEYMNPIYYIVFNYFECPLDYQIIDYTKYYIIWILLLITIMLIVFFFLFIRKILIYYNIEDFIFYLIRRYNRTI